MNLEDLRSEFLARGFDYLGPSRADTFLNDAYLVDICEEEDWPFLEAIATGPAPLTIENLRAIEYVTDTTQVCKLEPLRRGRIAEENIDLTQVGSPRDYYVTLGSIVNTFPVAAADQLQVRYWRVPTPLEGSDTPLLPARFHTLIVDGAVVRAYEDSDDYELAEAAEKKFERRYNRMEESLLNLQHDGPEEFIVITDPDAL